MTEKAALARSISSAPTRGQAGLKSPSAPLTFLGGAFYSISMLEEPWRTVTHFNPVVYLIEGFRWSFYGTTDIGVGISLAATLGFLLACMAVVWWIFRTGYRLKT